MRKDIYNYLEGIKIMGIKINYSDLARKFNCDARTVKNYATGKIKATRKKAIKKSKLDDFKTIVEDKVDNYCATALSIFKFIQERGYTGGYGLVKNYIREYKKDRIKKATIRFETNPGLQAQVDFKERKKMVSRNGDIFEINIFLYILGYSRIKYFEITENKNQKTLFNCLINAFKYTGGVPQEILFDNISSVVDRHNTYFKKVEYNKSFSQFAKDFNFRPVACRPYRAQTKGKVEAVSKLMNRLDVYNNEFETIEDLRELVRKLNRELNNEICQSINCTPNSRMKEEKRHLISLPNIKIVKSYIDERKEYKVSKESMITYLGNKYSVPTAFIGKYVLVEVSWDTNRLKIFNNDDLIVEHKISNKLLNYKKEHAIEILKSEAFKYSSLEEIESTVEKNLKHMDILLS